MATTPTERSEYEWATRTYPEVMETAEADGSMVVLPIGSVEQHGYHLPMATDTILAEEMARVGAERVGEDAPILTLPPIWGGYSPHHVDFGGAVTISFERLRGYVEDVVTSATAYGFDAVLLLNGHGGNNALVSAVVNTIGASHPDLELLGIPYFSLAESFIDDLRESSIGGMSHGGEFETSLMMHFHPELVREDAEFAASIRDEPYDHAGTEMFDGGPLSVHRSFTEYSEVGPIGEPELATAEKGAAITDLLGDELEHLLRQIHDEARS